MTFMFPYFFLFPFFFFKSNFFFSFYLGLSSSILFLISIFLLNFFFFKLNFFNFSNSSEKVFFFFFFSPIFLILILSFSFFDSFFFLLFVESLNFFLISSILYFSKDLDKVFSCFLMFCFNLVGSVPFMIFSLFFMESFFFEDYFSSLGCSIFLLLCFIFLLACKIPTLFLHFWLTKAHVSAFGFCSMILASLILKIGSFGIFKFPFYPSFSPFILLCWSIFSLLFLSILMFRFSDLKYSVACSSISHMSFLLPFFLFKSSIGVLSCLLMLISHGLISLVTFFLVSLLYESCFSRSIVVSKSFKVIGLSNWILVFFWINLGVPPFLNFLSEFLFFFEMVHLSNLFFPAMIFCLLLCGFFLVSFIFPMTFSKSCQVSYFFFPFSFYTSMTFTLFSLPFLFFLYLYLFSLKKKMLSCGGGDYGMINFRMGSYAFFFFSIFVFSCFYLVPSNCLNFDFFVKIYEFIPEFLFSFSIDYTFFYFSFMVSTVSYMVFIFSSIYLEFYNNLKYLKLLSFFIASMLFLCSCSSLMPFFTGWDFLGISSILLILFYPNKITSFNTFITFFFNRLSDCMLIFCLCFVLLESSMLFFSENYFFVIFMILCAFVKSAQYPFSSWLPAAMSAPTPISSLVHSSTLVTAGILILFKSSSFMFFFFSNLCSIFLLGALVGGSLACLEWDLKKMVAYSTLSQISVIMLMSSLGFLSLGMVHMIFHAFFKSFLFFSCGMFFMSSFSNQFYGSSTSTFLTHFLIWVSVFSMSGILFSSSFLTKDLFLEFQLENSLDFMFYFFLLISLLTLIYCNFLLVGVSSSFSNYTSKGNFFMYKSLCGFSLLLLVSPFYLFFLNLKESSFFLSWSELFILCSIFLSTLFMSIFRSFKLSYLSFDTFHLKSSLSLGFSRPLLYDMKDIFSGDYFMFKSNLLWIFSVNKYWVSFLFFVVFLLTL